MDLGLIDEIGYLDNAVARARNMAGISPQRGDRFLPPPGRPGDFALFGHSQRAVAGQIAPGQCSGAESFAPPSFLYLWEMDPTVEAINGK